jgi:hypothetical protein
MAVDLYSCASTSCLVGRDTDTAAATSTTTTSTSTTTSPSTHSYHPDGSGDSSSGNEIPLYHNSFGSVERNTVRPGVLAFAIICVLAFLVAVGGAVLRQVQKKKGETVAMELDVFMDPNVSHMTPLNLTGPDESDSDVLRVNNAMAAVRLKAGGPSPARPTSLTLRDFLVGTTVPSVDHVMPTIPPPPFEEGAVTTTTAAAISTSSGSQVASPVPITIRGLLGDQFAFASITPTPITSGATLLVLQPQTEVQQLENVAEAAWMLGSGGTTVITPPRSSTNLFEVGADAGTNAGAGAGAGKGVGKGVVAPTTIRGLLGEQFASLAAPTSFGRVDESKVINRSANTAGGATSPNNTLAQVRTATRGLLRRSNTEERKQQWWKRAKKNVLAVAKKMSKGRAYNTMPGPSATGQISLATSATSRWQTVQAAVTGATGRAQSRANSATSPLSSRPTSPAEWMEHAGNSSTPALWTSPQHPAPDGGCANIGGAATLMLPAGTAGAAAVDASTSSQPSETDGGAVPQGTLRKFSGHLEVFTRSRASSLNTDENVLSRPGSSIGGSRSRANSSNSLSSSSRPTSPLPVGTGISASAVDHFDHIRRAAQAAAEEEEEAIYRSAPRRRSSSSGQGLSLRALLDSQDPATTGVPAGKNDDDDDDDAIFETDLGGDAAFDNVLHEGRTVPANQTPQDNPELQEHLEWLHNRISRSQAVARLSEAGNPDSGFLLRSIGRDRYVLDIVVSKKEGETMIMHHLVARQAGGHTFQLNNVGPGIGLTVDAAVRTVLHQDGIDVLYPVYPRYSVAEGAAVGSNQKTKQMASDFSTFSI